MVEASALRSRAPACGLAGDLLLSGPSISKSLVRDAATRLSPPASPQKDAHHLPRDLLHGWHSTVGRAPSGRGRTPMRQFFSKLGAVFIILATPPSATFTVWTIYSGDEAGTMTGTLGKIWNRPGALLDMFAPVTTRAMGFVAAYALFEAVIMMVVPGKTFLGPVTAGGKQPVYKANGMQCFVLTLLTYAVLYWQGILQPTAIYEELPAMITFLNCLSPVVVGLLVLKGHYWPSCVDSGSSGSLIMDVYWGVELYPRLLWGKLDIKTFTNCRFGMMSWAVLVITYALAQYEQLGYVADSLMVSMLLQLLYVGKFFWWETGYWSSIDIMHDRAGWMICWGCLVWIPAVYTSPAMYLTKRPINLGPATAAAVLLLGVVSVFLNYDSDAQRQKVRRSGGKAKVWGKTADIIRAKYVTATGEMKESILLVCGWWGVVRHFNYMPELAAAFLWTVPCQFGSGMPYFYFVFLVVLLSDRARRDDRRCKSKYGVYWDEYCKRVPYKMIPLVY